MPLKDLANVPKLKSLAGTEACHQKQSQAPSKMPPGTVLQDLSVYKYLQFKPDAGLQSQLRGLVWESALFKTMSINVAYTENRGKASPEISACQFTHLPWQSLSPKVSSAPVTGAGLGTQNMLSAERAGKRKACT